MTTKDGFATTGIGVRRWAPIRTEGPAAGSCRLARTLIFLSVPQILGVAFVIPACRRLSFGGGKVLSTS